MLVLIAVPLSDGVKAEVERVVASVGARPVFEEDYSVVEGSPAIIFGVPPLDYVEKQKELRWIQTPSAGVDPYTVGPKRLPQGIKLTNSSGVYGPAGGDHVMAMVLYFSRGLYFYQRMKEQGKWVRDMSYARRLLGQTMCILGLGDLGRNVAQRASAFGMRVVGVKRTPGRVPGVERIVTTDQLDTVLPETDHLVITLPHTRETAGLVDRRRIGLLPKGAYLYNIGRGAVVDQDALVDALYSGHLAGAGLDVFVEEPLPEGHPLWQMENVVVTPHLGADTPWDNDHAAEVFMENLGRFVRGETLVNEVDPEIGY